MILILRFNLYSLDLNQSVWHKENVNSYASIIGLDQDGVVMLQWCDTWCRSISGWDKVNHWTKQQNFASTTLRRRTLSCLAAEDKSNVADVYAQYDNGSCSGRRGALIER